MKNITIKFENVPDNKVQQVKQLLTNMLMDFGDGMDSEEGIDGFDVCDGEIIVTDI